MDTTCGEPRDSPNPQQTTRHKGKNKKCSWLSFLLALYFSLLKSLVFHTISRLPSAGVWGLNITPSPGRGTGTEVEKWHCVPPLWLSGQKCPVKAAAKVKLL